MGKLRHRPVRVISKAVKQQSCKELDPKSWPTEMPLSAPRAADLNQWRNRSARLVVISKTSRARGAAEELRAAELRRGFFPAFSHHIMDRDKISQRLLARASPRHACSAQQQDWAEGFWGQGAPGREWPRSPKKMGGSWGKQRRVGAETSWQERQLGPNLFQFLVLPPHAH